MRVPSCWADSSPRAAENPARRADRPESGRHCTLWHMLCSRGIPCPDSSDGLSACRHLFRAHRRLCASCSLAAAWAVRPSRPYASKPENYECGAAADRRGVGAVPRRLLLVALIFLVFDTLAVFLFPWALTLRALGRGRAGAMLGFVAILGLAGSTRTGRGYSSGNKAASAPDPVPLWTEFKDLQEWERAPPGASGTGDKHSALFERSPRASTFPGGFA